MYLSRSFIFLFEAAQFAVIESLYMTFSGVVSPLNRSANLTDLVTKITGHILHPHQSQMLFRSTRTATIVVRHFAGRL